MIYGFSIDIHIRIHRPFLTFFTSFGLWTTFRRFTFKAQASSYWKTNVGKAEYDAAQIYSRIFYFNLKASAFTYISSVKFFPCFRTYTKTK